MSVNPAGPNYSSSALYVGDLKPDVTEAQLFEHFSTAGQVLSIRVCRDRTTKKSLGYAYVNFHLQADAERVLDEKKFDELNGKAMRITFSQCYPSSSALYVGDLKPDVTEAQLFEHFSTAGQVLSIRVCRDRTTKKSLGYAYVNFHLQADAERVLDEKKFDELNGKAMRITFYQRDPTLRKSGVGNIFIKNLHKAIDNKALYNTFIIFGNIISCKIKTDEHMNSLGYGFVQFETHEDAEDAIKNVDNMLNVDSMDKVYVGCFRTKNQRAEENGSANRRFTNVYVKNFGDNIEDEQLGDMFKNFGEITSAVVARGEDGKSKGHGFINFKDAISAKNAIENMNESEFNGKKLFVANFKKKFEREQERENNYIGFNLYIKNLDNTIDNERLRKEFVSFGTIMTAEVMQENGCSKGFGFVSFCSPEDATKAIDKMNGLFVGSKPLYVSFAQRKEDRKIHLASHFAKYHQAPNSFYHQIIQNAPAYYNQAPNSFHPQIIQNAPAYYCF